jgi:hypothetical protein
MVLFNAGPGRADETCKHLDVSNPHASVNLLSRLSDRIFASGNERTILSFQDLGYSNVGYKFKSTDNINLLVELMNMNMEHKLVYLTMTYDIIEGHPFKEDIKTIWLDERNCGTSEINPPDGKSKWLK